MERMVTADEKQLESFLKELKRGFEFYDERSETPRGGINFKRHFFPPAEQTFVSRPGAEHSSELGCLPPEPPKEFVVFGLGLPDLEALTVLDEAMKKPNQDFYYLRRREKAIVIGLVKEKIDAAPGGDVVFAEIGAGKYKALANGEKGEKLIEKYKRFFGKDIPPTTVVGGMDAPRIPAGESLNGWQRSMRELLLDPELLAKAVEWSRGREIWDELKEKCLGCGVCTYVCPICYCFSIEDKVGLDGSRSRCRKWDACTLPEFAKIAGGPAKDAGVLPGLPGGHNFRPTIKERYYNWFYHKFVRAYKEYGKPQCVGCGRCKKYCPARIDIKEVLETILKDYKKSMAES